ncbi:MAG: carboxypeptidase regulatory-like domain-containing protein [Acidobacteria bacterium]|nr:carboxypeptidase regulatory-like domain-containing protein [Acidobacteriota bacterium]
MRSRCATLALLALIAAGVDARAQVQGGTISGTVTDEQGGRLPGAVVIAQGLDATLSINADAAGEYRFLNLAPGPYKVSAGLNGFTTVVRHNVIVMVGRNVDLPMSLRVAVVAETVTVTGESPMVDPLPIGTAVNFSADELEKIPTSRDPTALLRAVPGVLIDRMNIGGNETGQAGNFVSKATRAQDQVWTLDGVNITDMASTSTPTYYNFDNFEEIQVSTAGQDVRQPTGGLGINLVIKRGTNAYRGNVRGYYSGERLESDNTPAALRDLGVRHICPAGLAGCVEADHNRRISDYGFEAGGPLVRDKAWFFGSYAVQDIQLVRRAGALVDKTLLKDPNLKINWHATGRDMVSFLYFDGFKIKDGRSPNTFGIANDAFTATFHQDNAYSAGRPHGLWKIADDRTFGSTLFVSGTFAYYNTGFVLEPEGGLDMQAGRSLVTASSYGSYSESRNVRPQKTVTVDANAFLAGMGTSHDLKFGAGFRRVDAFTGTRWPGNMILAIEQARGDLRAQLFRQGYGGNQTSYFDAYAADKISRDRMTIDLGLRFDRQGGKALPSATLPNEAFPLIVPGIEFAGYDAPFTWRNLSPRAGLSYALNESRRTVARLTYSRFAGQLPTGIVGIENPTSVAGSVTYRWTDLNADHFAQAEEVDLTRQVGSPAGGFDPANPTAVTSSSRIDPALQAPITSSLVAGIEHELMPAMALRLAYSYSRTSRLYGNLGSNTTPRRAVGLEDYAPGPGFSGTLPDGTTYDVPTYIPSAAKIAAGPSGFLTTTIPDFYTDYHGVEAGLVKRLSNRWMAQANIAWNSAREHFTSAAGMYDTNGNPTRTLAEPLIDGGQFAPQVGNVFPNAKWSLNASGMYVAPHEVEISANVYGRQGFPFPLFRPGSAAALGADASLAVLVTPRIDYFRYPNLWNTDLRLARTFRAGRASVRLIADLFNAFNAGTTLVKGNNVTAANLNVITQNLSPRIARFGVVVGF